MKLKGAFLVAVAAAPLLAGWAVAAPPAQPVAEFSHAHGWDASGALQAQCYARGFRFRDNATIGFDLRSDGGSLTVYETWLNRTAAYGPLPVVLDATADQYVRSVDVPAGPLRVAWAPESRAFAFDYDGPKKGGRLSAEFNATQARLGPVVDRVPTGFYAPFDFPPFGLLWAELGIPDLGRRVAIGDAPVHAEGDLGLFAWGAHLSQAGGFDFRMPPFRQEVARVGTDEANVRTLLLTFGALHLPRAVLDFPPGVAEPVCYDLDATVDGTATFHDAVGRVEAGGRTVNFTRQEFTLAGRFDLAERLATAEGDADPVSKTAVEGVARARATGTFTAVGLDFDLVATPEWDAWNLAARASLAAALLLAASLVVAKASRLVGLLFTRLAPHRLLDHPLRSAIASHVDQRPGLILRDLVLVTGRPYAVVRHHANVLAAAGRLKLFRRGKACHVYPSQASLLLARRNLLLAHDASVRFLVDRVGQASLSTRAVQAELRSRLGLSRMGAWKALRRALAADLVRRVPTEGGVSLCVPKASPA
ncbi:MAG: hypothetical protein ACRDKW_00025 [Actinomycetota bacterium]